MLNRFRFQRDNGERVCPGDRGSAAEVIKRLIALGVMVSINNEIDADTATLVGEEFGVTVLAAPSEEETLQVEEIVDQPESLNQGGSCDDHGSC